MKINDASITINRHVYRIGDEVEATYRLSVDDKIHKCRGVLGVIQPSYSEEKEIYMAIHKNLFPNNKIELQAKICIFYGEYDCNWFYISQLLNLRPVKL